MRYAPFKNLRPSALAFLLTGTLSAVSLAASEGNPPQKNLELKEAVEKALQNNPSLREVQERINQVGTTIPLARANILPNLSLVGTGSRQRVADNVVSTTRAGDNPYDQYSASLKLTQPLFQVGAFAAVHATEKDFSNSKLDAQIAARDLTNGVLKAYYEVALSSRNLQTLIQQQKIVHESLGVAQRRERSGRGQLLDVLQIKTQLALLDGQILTGKDQLDVSIANLTNLLGENSSENHQIQIQDKLDAPEIAEVDKDVEPKKNSIFEIEKDANILEKIEDQKSVAWGQNLPTLDLVGSYNYNSYRPADLLNQSGLSWTVGLQLTIPLFSGFSSSYQQKSLLSQQYQTEFDKRSVENNVSLQQVTSRKNLEAARHSIETGTEALKLAIASSKEAVRNFRLATIDFLQLLSVQQAFVQAQQALDTDKYNYIVALSNYYVSLGHDMNHLVQILDKANRE